MGNFPLPVIISLVVGLVGSGGIVFGALRYNRDEAGKIVTQQTNVLTDMRGLNDELNESLGRMRAERDELIKEVGTCKSETQELSVINARLAREYRNVEREKDEAQAELRNCRLQNKELRTKLRTTP